MDVSPFLHGAEKSGGPCIDNMCFRYVKGKERPTTEPAKKGALTWRLSTSAKGSLQGRPIYGLSTSSLSLSSTGKPRRAPLSQSCALQKARSHAGRTPVPDWREPFETKLPNDGSPRRPVIQRTLASWLDGRPIPWTAETKGCSDAYIAGAQWCRSKCSPTFARCVINASEVTRRRQ